MTRKIGAIGILDYELTPQLQGKYKRTNFKEDQFLITSFLYAHDNEFAVADAIRELIARGCSGLLIKNVFHLKLNASAIQYANAKNFPIFLTDSQDLMFEDLIVDVTAGILRAGSADQTRKQIDRILRKDCTFDECLQEALRLNPSFQNQHCVYYVPGPVTDTAAMLECFSRYQDSKLDRPENLLAVYGSGLLLIYSWEHHPAETTEKILPLLRRIAGEDPDGTIGISDQHFHLGELRQALTEAFLSSSVCDAGLLPGRASISGDIHAFEYRDLGVLQILLPYYREPVLQKYRERIIRPLEEFDIENGGKLTETLVEYIRCGCHYTTCAANLGQHENTIRYRLGKITELTGLDCRNVWDLEQLHLAWLISACSDRLFSVSP